MYNVNTMTVVQQNRALASPMSPCELTRMTPASVEPEYREPFGLRAVSKDVQAQGSEPAESDLNGLTRSEPGGSPITTCPNSGYERLAVSPFLALLSPR